MYLAHAIITVTSDGSSYFHKLFYCLYLLPLMLLLLLFLVLLLHLSLILL